MVFIDIKIEFYTNITLPILIKIYGLNRDRKK